METILIILGKETSAFAKGQYNQGLFDAAIELLQSHYRLLSTVVEDGYEVAKEIEKFKQADAVVYQYPINWFIVHHLSTIFPRAAKAAA